MTLVRTFVSKSCPGETAAGALIAVLEVLRRRIRETVHTWEGGGDVEEVRRRVVGHGYVS